MRESRSISLRAQQAGHAASEFSEANKTPGGAHTSEAESGASWGVCDVRTANAVSD
jgi:hypothetical protein